MGAEPCYPGRFDPDVGLWSPTGAGPGAFEAPRTLTVATFNTWFGNHHNAARYGEMFDLVQECGADVIGLQEVTPELLEMALHEPWIREGFYCSDPLGLGLGAYGNLLLSRFPFESLSLHQLPSRMDRKLLLAEYRFHGESLHVGVVHLESRKPSAELRGQQLAYCFPLLDRGPHALLLGDLNFCSSWSHENRQIPPRYLDLWPALRPHEPGYTEDTDLNAMRFQIKGEAKQVRFDRILLRSEGQAWKPRTIELLGTEEMAPEYPGLWPSDHFGLAATLEWQAA